MAKPGAFEEPVSPLGGFRNLDLTLRVLSTLVCITIIILGGITAGKGGVILIGILGPPVRGIPKRDWDCANKLGGMRHTLVVAAIRPFVQQI